MIFYKRLAVTSALLLALNSGAQAADAKWGTGLEQRAARQVYLGIEEMNQRASAIGLERERLFAHVALRLRQHGLNAAAHEATHPVLYIRITALTASCSVEVSFVPPVYYQHQNEWYIRPGKVWNEGTTCTLPSEGELSYILEIVDQIIDQFAYDYIKANEVQLSTVTR